MARPKTHEDRRTYQREWQRAKQRKLAQEQRAVRFKRLLDDVMMYEQRGMTYQEIADELAKDFRYRLTIKETNYDK